MLSLIHVGIKVTYLNERVPIFFLELTLFCYSTFTEITKIYVKGLLVTDTTYTFTYVTEIFNCCPRLLYELFVEFHSQLITLRKQIKLLLPKWKSLTLNEIPLWRIIDKELSINRLPKQHSVNYNYTSMTKIKVLLAWIYTHMTVFNGYNYTSLPHSQNATR